MPWPGGIKAGCLQPCPHRIPAIARTLASPLLGVLLWVEHVACRGPTGASGEFRRVRSPGEAEAGDWGAQPCSRRGAQLESSSTPAGLLDYSAAWLGASQMRIVVLCSGELPAGSAERRPGHPPGVLGYQDMSCSAHGGVRVSLSSTGGPRSTLCCGGWCHPSFGSTSFWLCSWRYQCPCPGLPRAP